MTDYKFFFNDENRAVTMTLIHYSIWMFALPITTFFFSHYIIFDAKLDTMGYSGILAVVAANIVIAAYVRMAWLEEQADIAQRQDNLKTD
mmetsp:Transcript_19685/g.19784  ORF Transcript_19685/g.19784 Transcript_19685/m.19784 type:complete len:90 (+) Transcript_19685:288-557(+)